MSEDITFKELLDLPEKFFKGQSGIIREATVKKALKPREVKSPEGAERSYHFFSQFIVANDKTADMGLDLTIGKVEDACKEGMTIRLENGKAETYKDKNGDTQRKLKGKITKIIRGTDYPKPSGNGYETLQDGRTVVSREVWEKKDALITRTAIAKSLIEAGRKWNKTTEKEASGWLEWVVNGKPEPKDEQKPEEKKDKQPREERDEPPEGILDDTTVAKEMDQEQIHGEFSSLYTEAFKKGILNKNYNVKHWLMQHFNKELPGQLTSDEYARAVVLMRKEIEESREQDVGIPADRIK